MAKKATLAKLAERAGVSTATVDRVMHGRSGYSLKSEQLVKRAIDELGYGKLPENLLAGTLPKLEFLLLLPSIKSFFRDAIEENARTICAKSTAANINLTVEDILLVGSDSTIAALRNVDPDRTHGVCLFAIDSPGIKAEIDRLADLGIHVCTIVSDVPSSRRFSYVGLENVAAGRTAGRMIQNLVGESKGSVGVVTGSNHIRDHLERYMGVGQTLVAGGSRLRLLPAAEGFSFNDRNEDIVREMIVNEPDLVAIYSIAGGSIGLIEGVRKSGRAKDLTVVVHELEPVVRDALIDGTVDMVLHQNTKSMMRLSIDALVDACAGRVPQAEKLPIEIYIAENLP